MSDYRIYSRCSRQSVLWMCDTVGGSDIMQGNVSPANDTPWHQSVHLGVFESGLSLRDEQGKWALTFQRE